MFQLKRHLSRAIFLWLILMAKPGLVVAVDYVHCAVDATCNLGEFLYDDSYSPIATASCTVTTRDPTGTLILDAEAMTAGSDGWYDYDLDTTDFTAGVYPTQICCTHLTDYLCIDKTFTINLPDLSASDIWSYPNRSITDFGTLVADIWSYTTRSLTNFGTLVSSIWSHPDRTLTSANLDVGMLATTSALLSTTDNLSGKITDVNNNLNTKTTDVKNEVIAIRTAIATLSGTPVDNDLLNQIYAQVLDNRDVLDALVNEPVVQTFIDDGSEPPDLQSKIDQTRTTTGDAYATTQQIISRLNTINQKLKSLNSSAVTNELAEISLLLNNPQSPALSLTGQIGWLEKAWGSRLTEPISREAGEALAAVKTAQSKLMGTTNPTSAGPQLITALDSLRRVNTLTGSITDSSTDSTLYGHLYKVIELAAALDENDQAISALLGRWQQEPNLNKTKTIAQIENSVLSVNQLSQPQKLINQNGDTPDLKLKNHLFGLQAISQINRLLLAKMAGQPIGNLWLEEGSVIFRALILNPSERITQTIPLKYYLPHEVRLEDIIQADPELTINFDPDQNAVYISGSFSLAPGESRTYAVEVTDIFVISSETINSLRNQAQELLKPLQKTSFFGQGATLKSDIDVMLDKIAERQTSALTPENRIRAYRENQIELAGIKQKLDSLKTLLADSGSTTAIFGFVGGIQSVALWGIVIIIIAGFVFLSIYLKQLRREAYARAGYTIGAAKDVPDQTGHSTLSWPQELIQRYLLRLDRLRLADIDPGTKLFQIIFIILGTSVLTVIIITTIIFNPHTLGPSTARSVLGSRSDSPATSAPSPTKDPDAITLPQGTQLFAAPDPAARLTHTLTNPTPAVVLKTDNGFTLVELPDDAPVKHGWTKI